MDGTEAQKKWPDSSTKKEMHCVTPKKENFSPTNLGRESEQQK